MARGMLWGSPSSQQELSSIVSEIRTPAMSPVGNHQHRIVLRNTVVAVFGGLVFLLLVWAYLDAYSNLVKTTRDMAAEQLTVEYRSLSQYQAELARQVVEDNIDQPEIVSLMAQASRTADVERLVPLRHELLERLSPLYERMRQK